MTGIQATVAAALERLSLLDSMLNQLVRLASSSASASAAGGRRAAGACRSSKLGTLPASPQLAPDTPQRGGDGSERAPPAPSWARGGYRGPPPSKRLALLLAHMPPQDAAGVLQARSFLSQF
ncbi:zinc finger 423 isoform X2 [Micractinium conductrix]|uniref:Zinc finger 423 isoform X2 n=1 Tax=Micractinium conductrix TaxID=554055 RepID=A0A2P6VNR5_9CHLO|nr:zinc finger 423 isoform X2 [Micractinium conductrix]|eukprot:PSC75720.1 zinc finger 423 isoform X2 [Micractinium conductrix]